MKFCQTLFFTCLGLNWLNFGPLLFTWNMGAVFANFWMNWFWQVLSLKKWTLAKYFLSEYLHPVCMNSIKKLNFYIFDMCGGGVKGLNIRITASKVLLRNFFHLSWIKKILKLKENKQSKYIDWYNLKLN